MNYKNLLQLFVVSTALFSLSGCFDTTGSSKMDLQSARNSAISGISARAGNAFDNLNTAVFDTQSVALLQRAGIPGLSASATSTSQNPIAASRGIAKGKVTAKPNLAKRLARSTQQVASRDTGTSTEEQFASVLEPLLVNGTVNGDTVTYHPDASTFCVPDDSQCIELINNITIVQTISSANEGVLSFRFRDTATGESYTMFDIGYGADYVYFEVDLAGTKGVLDVLVAADGTNTANTNVTAEGRVRMTVRDTGSDTASLSFGVTQHVLVSDSSDAGEYSFDMATAPDALVIDVDGVAKTASVSLGIGAIAAAFSDTASTSTFDLGGITGLFNITNQGNDLVATNFGITDRLTYTIDDQTALDLALAPLGFTVNGADETITFDTDIDMDFNVKNVDGQMGSVFDQAQDPTDPSLEGSLTAHADINTMVYAGNDVTAGDYGKILTGLLSVTGTSYYDGTVSLTDGECFASTDSTPGSSAFPFASITCP